jgi:hypothetical protein
VIKNERGLTAGYRNRAKADEEGGSARHSAFKDFALRSDHNTQEERMGKERETRGGHATQSERLSKNVRQKRERSKHNAS